MNHPGTGSEANRDGVTAERTHREEARICEQCWAEFFSFSEFLEHKKNCTKPQPSQVLRKVPGRAAAARELKEKRGAQSVVYLKAETALPTASQAINYLPKGKVANTKVTLQALRGTKVPVSRAAPSASSPSAAADPARRAHPRAGEHVGLARPPLGGAGADTLKTLGSRRSQQVSAAVALLSQKAGSQGLSLDTLKPAQLPHETPLPPPAPGAGALRPEAQGDQGACCPTSCSVLFQSPFSTVALDLSKKGKGKPPNVSPVGAKPKDEAVLCKHKCKHCSKGFGTNSSLETLLCSVCGHRFTTKGNLKANPQLFAELHGKMTAGNGIPYALSVPVPIDESSLSLDSKPVLYGYLRISLQGLTPRTSWAARCPTPCSPGLPLKVRTDPYRLGVGVGVWEAAANHTSPRFGGFQERGTPEPGSQTLKLKQLVENMDKATTDPNKCLTCHRLLSCQSSLKVHYRPHTGESPFHCKICGRAFSTKGNLKTHLGVRRANTSVKTPHSCRTCQKKFRNVVLQQLHIRMHVGGQIPNTPLPENPCDFAGPQAATVSQNGSAGATCHDDVIEGIDGDERGAPRTLRGGSPRVQGPLGTARPRVRGAGCPGRPGEGGPAPRVLQRQSRRGHGLTTAVVLGDGAPGGAGLKSRCAGDRVLPRLPSTFPRAQPTWVKPRATPMGGTPRPHTAWEGPLLRGAPQIHERTRTAEKPCVCNICGRAVTTKGNLQLASENSRALLGADGRRVPEMFPEEILAPAVVMGPVVWTQYTTVLSGGLAMKTNELSVIQSGGIPTLPVNLGASSPVNTATMSEMSGSQPAISAEVEKPGAAHNLPKHQFPHFLEENKIAVS
ncbi:unnamed protein product [Nyctereutes procyonoides]|uniref:(raccoon dog) hypothetical protein n=1 Tax=Nyctereutes procyonoides TaxID=34880 RepID=A0A811Y8F8_NYCPR|nr:unnamed protein product [Nyctereutes procyonoides]